MVDPEGLGAGEDGLADKKVAAEEKDATDVGDTLLDSLLELDENCVGEEMTRIRRPIFYRK